MKSLQLSERQLGWELGLGGTVNICELLVNVVTKDKPKALTGLDQKVRGQERRLVLPLLADAVSSANRQHLPRPDICVEHGKPVLSPFLNGRGAVRRADDDAGRGARKKRTLACNGPDRAVFGRRYPTRKGADFREVLNHENPVRICTREGK